MKKLLLVLIGILMVSIFACTTAQASWSVTVSWTKSIGPNLQHEEVLYSGVSKCSITPPAVTTCNFSILTLAGDVVIRSFNAQGAFVDTTAIPIQAVPAPATGITVIMTYVP